VKNRKNSFIAIVVLICTVMSGVIVDISIAESDKTSKAAEISERVSERLEKALETIVYPALDEVDIATAIRFLKRSADVCVVVDVFALPVVDEVQVNMALPELDVNDTTEPNGIEAKEVIDLISKHGGLKVRLEGGAVFLATLERMEEICRTEHPFELFECPERLLAYTSCDINDEPLPDVLSLMAEVGGANLVLHQQGRYELRDARVSLQATDIPVVSILRFLIRQHKLDMELVGEALFVARPERLKSVTQMPPIENANLKDKLGQTISYRCIDRLLPDVVNDLGGLAGLSIRYEPPADRRPPRVSFAFADLPVSTVLDLVVRSTGVAAQVNGDNIVLFHGAQRGQ